MGTGFREGLNVVQDMALILDITMRGGSLYYDPQVAFMYRRHGGSDSSWRALEVPALMRSAATTTPWLKR